MQTALSGALERADVIADILVEHDASQSSLLPILHDIQLAFGFVPAPAIAIVAAALNLSRAEVHGVVTFYHDFKITPSERPTLKLCRAEACQARGVDSLTPLVEADARVALETVYCLGLCASGPAALVGDRLVARLDRNSLLALLDEITA